MCGPEEDEDRGDGRRDTAPAALVQADDRRQANHGVAAHGAEESRDDVGEPHRAEHSARVVRALGQVGDHLCAPHAF